VNDALNRKTGFGERDGERGTRRQGLSICLEHMYIHEESWRASGPI
jgi:hypothetical protein